MNKKGITNSYYCNKYGFQDGLRRIKKHGYDGIDYQGFMDSNSLLYEMNSHELEQHLREQYKEITNQGLFVHQVHGPWRCPPKDSTPEERAERFKKMSRSIFGAAMLGAKNMVIHPLMPCSTVDIGYEERTRDVNLQFFESLSKVGRDNGVVICLENMPFLDLSISTVPEIINLVRDVDNDYLKICLDTGHCAVFGASPAEAVRMIGKEQLRALHIHDNDGKMDYHWRPFEGVIDWDDFGNALHEIGYEGVISLETGINPIPEELCEYEEIGLYRKVDYIARLANGKEERE